MHRAGANPENMQPADFLCNFCERAWDGRSAMVEGHQGNLICGKCLTIAYRALVMHEGESVGPGLTCSMCLEERDQSEWQSPVRDEAVVCERCVRQAAQALSKDPESGWARPDRLTE
jgi:ClpX C4-type zinc finger